MGRRAAAFALLAGMCLSAPVSADSFRCDGALVQTGDPAASVRAACGEPSFVDPWVGGSSLAYGVAPSMEQWTYNRGPNRLLRILVFRNGRLQAIRSDGHGFRERAGASDCRPSDIVRGMSKYRLRQACGEPAQRSGGVFVYSSRRDLAGRTYYQRRGRVPVFRERWIFNFGPNRFLREVTLENAMVVDTETLDRGYDE